LIKQFYNDFYFSNFPLILLTVPQKFYLEEILLCALVAFGVLYMLLQFYLRQKSTCTLYTSAHYNRDITYTYAGIWLVELKNTRLLQCTLIIFLNTEIWYVSTQQLYFYSYR